MRTVQQHYIDRSFHIFVQLATAAIIIGLLTSIAVQYYLRTFQVSLTSVALSMSGPLKSEIHAFYIKNGFWPNTNDFTQLGDYLQKDATVSDIIIENGSFHFRLNSKFAVLGGQVLSFRKAEFTQELDTPLWWLCGYAATPKGMQVDVDNKTSINKKYLPRICQ